MRFGICIHQNVRGNQCSALCRFAGRWLLLVFALAFISHGAGGQTTSTLQGVITDQQGLAVAGAEIHVVNKSIGVERAVTTGPDGSYRVAGLSAAIYTISLSKAGFASETVQNVEITVNSAVILNLQLRLSQLAETVDVPAVASLLQTEASSAGSTILPLEIEQMPINGRNYLDLMQLVPGVAINRQADAGSDAAVPVLGERGNNTGFLIDGLPNENELNGGAAAQFNQDTIAEFQVITSGYKAEFGHSSGGMVNVLTKSGGNQTHGLVSTYFRNNHLDSSDVSGKDVPYLLRWDYDAAAGGAFVRDKLFWFASAEEIHENRQLNFVNPPSTPQIILDQERSYDTPTTLRETRVFGKLEQVLGKHRLTEQVNYTNTHTGNFLPLSQSINLPSTRQNLGDRNLLLGFSDTATLGNSANPYILSLRGQYRREPSSISPAHPQAGPFTLDNIFSGFNSGGIFGDLGQVTFGSITTASHLDQKYVTLGASVAKTFGRHTFKIGWDFERTHIDGVEANLQENQLFATLDDYAQFGPINSGFFLLLTTGGLTPQANEIHLRNNYDGMFLQDDWKVAHNLTLNLGVRWDYDSRFDVTTNVSPRLGFAWEVTPKTVIRGSWGLFYDHFRLGIARDVPGFGGADLRETQPFSYPRLFYGVPTIAPALFGLCLSPTQTDAQIAGQACPYPFDPPGTPYYGIDHLNNVVAAGHAAIPANSVVNVGNIQQLSGLAPDQYLVAADAAIGQPAGFLFWGPFGALSYNIFPPGSYGVTIDPSFNTPYTRGFNIGVQREVSKEWVVSVDYYHKAIENILGVRNSDVPFESRLDNSFGGPYINGFGPWYSGTFNAGIISFEKRMSGRFTLGGSYNFASENDDAACSSFDSSLTGVCWPTDSFRGITPTVTDPGSATCAGGQTNAKGPFFACNGNYVPKAGIFYNGAHIDNGPSDLALRHTFELHGLIRLPWKVQFSSLFRTQSGFRYTESATVPLDQDGNNNFNGRDLKTGRNAFTAPKFVNMDLRVARTFVIKEKLKVQGLFEFFNLFNNANPAAIQVQQPITTPPFGAVSQTLPGREGQIGLRLEF